MRMIVAVVVLAVLVGPVGQVSIAEAGRGGGEILRSVNTEATGRGGGEIF